MANSSDLRCRVRPIAASLLCTLLGIACPQNGAPPGGDGADGQGPDPAALDAADAADLRRDSGIPPVDLGRRSCVEVIAGQTVLRSGVPWTNGREVKGPGTSPGLRTLTVSPAELRFDGDCMQGSLPGPVALGGAGKFQVDGSIWLTPGMPFPDMGGPRKATYFGDVRGDTLTLRIKFYDGTADHPVNLYCDDPIKPNMGCY